MTNLEFQPWPKIPRGGKGERVVITEKYDGTNACIVVDGGEVVAVQSRKRFITPDDDNYGFARWVHENLEDCVALGDGHHFGEWVGEGIQGNPMALEGKRLFLFNTFRFGEHNPTPPSIGVVPILYDDVVTPDAVADTMINLKASRPYLPEGVVAYYCASRRYEKFTYKFSRGKWDKE